MGKDNRVEKMKELYLIYIRPWLGMSFIYKVAAWVIVLVLTISATYSLLTDSGLIKEISNNGLGVILSKAYFKDFFFTPLWIVAGFLFNLANRHESQQIKKQKSDLLAFLKGKKEDVKVVEVLDFLHEGYDHVKDYIERDRKRKKVIEDSSSIPDEQLRI